MYREALQTDYSNIYNLLKSCDFPFLPDEETALCIIGSVESYVNEDCTVWIGISTENELDIVIHPDRRKTWLKGDAREALYDKVFKSRDHVHVYSYNEEGKNLAKRLGGEVLLTKPEVSKYILTKKGVRKALFYGKSIYTKCAYTTTSARS